MLRRLLKEDVGDCDKMLPYLLFTYREVPPKAVNCRSDCANAGNRLTPSDHKLHDKTMLT